MDVAARITALSRAGRGSKEIAAILGITTDDVQSVTEDPSATISTPPVVSNIVVERELAPQTVDLGADEERNIGAPFAVQGPGIFTVFGTLEFELDDPADAFNVQLNPVLEDGSYDAGHSGVPAALDSDPWVYREELILAPSQVARRRLAVSTAGNPGPVSLVGGVIRVTRTG